MVLPSLCRRDFRRSQWQSVLLSDKSQYAMLMAGCKYIVSETSDSQTAALQRGTSFIVLGGIIGYQKTDLVIICVSLNAQKYINNLNNSMLSFLRNKTPGIFQYDNARHSAHITRDFLTQNTVMSCFGLLRHPI